MTSPASLWAPIGAFTFEFARGEWARMHQVFDGLGVGAVQLSGALLDEAVEAPAIVGAVRDQFVNHGRTLAALGAYRNLVSADPDRRQANVAYVMACLERARDLGTPNVATEAGTLDPTGDWTDTPANQSTAAWDALDRALDALVPAAERAGAILALEGFINNVLKTPDQADRILRRYASPHLKLVCDPYNYLASTLLPRSAEATAEFLERFEMDFVIAHLKDVSAEGAEVDTPEFGRGVFPQIGYLTFLKERRPDLPLIFEHLPNERIPAAVAQVKAILAAGR